jgi:signal transduction histidine kinase
MARPLDLAADTVDMVAMVRRVVERHQAMTSSHRIRLEAPGQLVGWYDGQRLERVIDNLLGNALKFSPNGGEVRLDLRTEEQPTQGAQLVLSIEDQGIGIATQDLDRVFERFERGANATAKGIGGTGIGLAYVAEIVRAHGGTVGVESTEHLGSIFTVRLPLRTPAASEALGARKHV